MKYWNGYNTLLSGLALGFCIGVFYSSAGFSQATSPPLKNVKEVFIKCQGCHKADGSGGPGYGGYAADFRITTLNHEELVGVITNGRRNKGMPPFKDVLDNREIDELASYIETEFKGKK